MSKYFSSFFGNIKDNVNSYRINRTQRKIEELELLIENIKFVIEEEQGKEKMLLKDIENSRSILSLSMQINDDNDKQLRNKMLLDLDELYLRKHKNEMIELDKYLEKKENKLIKLKTQLEQLKQGRIPIEEEDDDVPPVANTAKTYKYNKSSNKVVPFGGNRRSRKKRRSKKKRR